MVTIGLNFSDTEIAEFFRHNGFTIAPYMRGRWVPAYHNQSEWMETEVPGLLVDGKIIDAEPVFLAYADRLRTGILNPRPDVERLLNEIFNTKK
jgi:hypothetical protein